MKCREPTSGNNNDEDEDDDAGNQAHSHLHILPPHLLPDSIGAATETLGGDGQVVGLVLEVVEALATLRHLVDVLSHHPHGVVNLLHGTQCQPVAPGLRSTRT